MVNTVTSPPFPADRDTPRTVPDASHQGWQSQAHSPATCKIVLFGHGDAHSFPYCPHLLLSYSGRAEYLRPRPCALRRVKYLLSASLQKKLADPCLRQTSRHQRWRSLRGGTRTQTRAFCLQIQPFFSLGINTESALHKEAQPRGRVGAEVQLVLGLGAAGLHWLKGRRAFLKLIHPERARCLFLTCTQARCKLSGCQAYTHRGLTNPGIVSKSGKPSCGSRTKQPRLIMIIL